MQTMKQKTTAEFHAHTTKLYVTISLDYLIYQSLHLTCETNSSSNDWQDAEGNNNNNNNNNKSFKRLVNSATQLQSWSLLQCWTGKTILLDVPCVSVCIIKAAQPARPWKGVSSWFTDSLIEFVG